jgi:hypothetical protein
MAIAACRGVDGEIKITMGASLPADEGVDSPASRYPDHAASAG